MKKLIIMAAACIAALTGCSKDDSQTKTDDPTEKVASVLNGHFVSQAESLGNIEYEELTFSPFATPMEIVSLFGTFTAYGSVVRAHYFDDHLLETGGTYYYTIQCSTVSSTTYVSFFQYSGGDVTGGEDKREYTPVSSTEFKLRSNGSAVQQTFVKK